MQVRIIANAASVALLFACSACGDYPFSNQDTCHVETEQGVVIRLPAYCEEEDALEPDDFGVVSLTSEDFHAPVNINKRNDK